MSEDQRLNWKGCSRLVTLVAAYVFVTKTGVPAFDWMVSVFASMLVFLVIDSQRTYSRLSPRHRKRIVRVIIFLCTWSVVIIGVAYFSLIGAASFAGVARSEEVRRIGTASSTLFEVVFLLVLVVAFFKMILRAVRQLGYEQLIYQLPKAGLVDLFVRKRFIARDKASFAMFELYVLFASLFYCSAFAGLARTVMEIIVVGF